MNERRVRFTETAREHVDQEQTWWLGNRDHQALFATELETTLKVVALLPGAGTAYVRSGDPSLRRVYLRKLGCHLYYTFDDNEVVIRALWGARREHGPTF